MDPILATKYSGLSQIAGFGRPDSLSARSQKALQAAREFEGQLLSSVFGELEKTFASIGPPSSDPGADNYQAMAMQALGRVVAHNGGIGIAAMIARHLIPPESVSPRDGHSASS
jgi:Rod binding domain-containing protein